MQTRNRDTPPRACCPPVTDVATAVRPSSQRPCTHPRASEQAPTLLLHPLCIVFRCTITFSRHSGQAVERKEKKKQNKTGSKTLPASFNQKETHWPVSWVTKGNDELGNSSPLQTKAWRAFCFVECVSCCSYFVSIMDGVSVQF